MPLEYAESIVLSMFGDRSVLTPQPVAPACRLAARFRDLQLLLTRYTFSRLYGA